MSWAPAGDDGCSMRWLIGGYHFGRWGMGKLARWVLARSKTMMSHKAGSPVVEFMSQDMDHIEATGDINAIESNGILPVEAELQEKSFTRQVLPLA